MFGFNSDKKKETIESIIKETHLKYDEPLKDHTTFGIGGKAKIFVTPNEEELIKLIKFLKENKKGYVIIGNGSNVLVSDDGIHDVTICIGNVMGEVKVLPTDNDDEMIIEAGAGALLSRIASVAKDNSLTGFEPLAGIPGSFGGGVLMNAGAYGAEIKDVLLDIRLLTDDGEIVTKTVDEISLSYRHSSIMDEGGIILSGRVKLKTGDKEEIKKKMEELAASRREKQPLEFKSAGSTFKRPVPAPGEEQQYASKLIDEAGLKGFEIGDAEVSSKHAGFIINKGNARATDVMRLIRDVQETVYKKFGVKLEPEVRILGDFPE